MTRNWLPVVLATALVSGVSGCGSGSAGGGASSTSVGSTTAAGTTDSPKEQAASRLRQLLKEYQIAQDRVDLRGGSPFADWHQAQVVYAETCHTLVAGLRQQPWPSEAQQLVDAFAALNQVDCVAYDRLAQARSFAELRAAQRTVRLPDRSTMTETKLALYDALGM